MPTIQLNLSDEVKEFLDAEATAKGFSSASDYVAALLRALQKREAWDRLEPLVLEGLASPAREMTATDWQSLRDRIDRIEAKQQP
jgi:putative addiction module CopG family antidote